MLSNDLFGSIDQITTRDNVLELQYESLRRYMFIELFRHWANVPFEKYPWAITFEVMDNCPMALPLATPLITTFSRRVWMWRMEVGMSKKKDIHILKIFPELSRLSMGKCIH
jgi:hypothetical protein